MTGIKTIGIVEVDNLNGQITICIEDPMMYHEWTNSSELSPVQARELARALIEMADEIEGRDAPARGTEGEFKRALRDFTQRIHDIDHEERIGLGLREERAPWAMEMILIGGIASSILLGERSKGVTLARRLREQLART